MKLAIGTANLEHRYGFKNSKLKKKEIFDLFKFVKKNGIDLIDTASIYGDSEKIIGAQKLNNQKIVTKIYLKNKDYSKDHLKYIFKKNLNRLKRKKIYSLLVHNIFDLQKNKRVFLMKSLRYLKKSKMVKKIGFSIYSPKDLKYFSHYLTPDILQIPINIFDRRFESKLFKKYVLKNKIEIHSRSCFLQGLIIDYQKNNIKFKKFKKWDYLFNKLDNFCKNFQFLE